MKKCIVYHLRQYDHYSAVSVTLHWLCIRELVQHKVALLTYKLLHGSAPRYLGPLVAVADLSDLNIRPNRVVYTMTIMRTHDVTHKTGNT